MEQTLGFASDTCQVPRGPLSGRPRSRRVGVIAHELRQMLLGGSRRAAVRPPRHPSSHCRRGSTDLAAASARRKEEPVCDAHRGSGALYSRELTSGASCCWQTGDDRGRRLAPSCHGWCLRAGSLRHDTATITACREEASSPQRGFVPPRLFSESMFGSLTSGRDERTRVRHFEEAGGQNCITRCDRGVEQHHREANVPLRAICAGDVRVRSFSVWAARQ